MPQQPLGSPSSTSYSFRWFGSRFGSSTMYNAIIVAGAGAAYLSGGLGGWEFAFCTLMTFVAYKGLTYYYFIGIGWLLHTAWDIVHHLYSNPIVPFDPASSAGCAVCDSILAVWFFAQAPSLFDLLRRKRINSLTVNS